jgi:copper chaperone
MKGAIAMTDTITSETPRATTFSAPDISCGGCANAIQRAVGTISGVADVAVDVTAKTVTVRHDAAVGETDLLNTLDRAGFPASVIPAGMGKEGTAVTTSCSCCQG